MSRLVYQTANKMKNKEEFYISKARESKGLYYFLIKGFITKKIYLGSISRRGRITEIKNHLLEGLKEREKTVFVLEHWDGFEPEFSIKFNTENKVFGKMCFSKETSTDNDGKTKIRKIVGLKDLQQIVPMGQEEIDEFYEAFCELHI